MKTSVFELAFIDEILLSIDKLPLAIIYIVLKMAGVSTTIGLEQFTEAVSLATLEFTQVILL